MVDSTALTQEKPAEGASEKMNHGAMHHDTIDPDDPLLIAQSLTYITDDGSTVLSFTSAPFSSCEFVALVTSNPTDASFGAVS